MSTDVMTMKELSAWVDEQGGVGAVELGELRDAVNADKLGKLIMGRIALELASHGLGYFPLEVIESNAAPRQHQVVRLYRKGNNAAAKAIEAVLTPSDNGDAFLAELSSDSDRDVLVRVRELVCRSA